MTHPTTTRYVGLDVHKSSIVIAVAVADAGGTPATMLATICDWGREHMGRIT